jgi:hypothetical protein
VLQQRKEYEVVDSTAYTSFQDLAKANLEGGSDMARTEDVQDSDVEFLRDSHECSGKWYDALAFTALINIVERILSVLWHVPPTDSEPERYVVEMEPKKLLGEAAIMRARCLDGVWRDVSLPRELWFQEEVPRRRCIGLDENGKEVHGSVMVTKEYRRRGQLGFRNPVLHMDKGFNVDHEALAIGKLKEVKFRFPRLCEEGEPEQLQRAIKALVTLAEENGKRGDKYRLPILRVLAIDPNTGVVSNAASGVISAETRRMSEIANVKGEADRFLDPRGEAAPYDGPSVDQLPDNKGMLFHPEYSEDMLSLMLENSMGPVWSSGSVDVGDKLQWVMPWGDVGYGPRRFLRGMENEDGTWTGPTKREFTTAIREFILEHESRLAVSKFKASDPEGMIPGRRLVVNPIIAGDNSSCVIRIASSVIASRSR